MTLAEIAVSRAIREIRLPTPNYGSHGRLENESTSIDLASQQRKDRDNNVRRFNYPREKVNGNDAFPPPLPRSRKTRPHAAELRARAQLLILLNLEGPYLQGRY